MSEIINDTGKRWGDLSMTEKFMVGWRQAGFAGSDLTTEHVFHGERLWRFDIAWPSIKVSIEFDGYGYSHFSQKGRRRDHDKQNAAVELGWLVLRYESTHLSLKRLPDLIEQVCNVILRRTGEHELAATAVEMVT